VSPAPVVARLRDDTPVGAWLLKANPSVWDLNDVLAGRMPADRWRLARSYRAGLLAPGQPVLLWVTRGDPGVTPGVWGTGLVTGEVVDDVGDPDDHRWYDEAARRQVRPYVEVRLDLLEQPLSADDVRGHPALSAMELFRAPRMGSPVAVTPTEWDAVCHLLLA
jgi:predicted RNA-binding protein with PUA-like domain